MTLLVLLVIQDVQLPVVCSADNAFVVKPNAANQLLVPLEYPQAGTTLDVPQTATESQTLQINLLTTHSKHVVFTMPSDVALSALHSLRIHYTAGRSGLAVAYLTAVREVPGSNRAVGSCVYRTTTAIYSLGHGLCAPFLQCLGQLSLLPSVGR